MPDELTNDEIMARYEEARAERAAIKAEQDSGPQRLGDLLPAEGFPVYDCVRTCTLCKETYPAKTFQASHKGKSVGLSGICARCSDRQKEVERRSRPTPEKDQLDLTPPARTVDYDA